MPALVRAAWHALRTPAAGRERPGHPRLAARARAWLSSRTRPTQDRSFTRNRIRHELLPALERAFPQFRDTFARSARHAAQAQRVLSAIGGRRPAPAWATRRRSPALRALDRARQANVLRHWLLADAPGARQRRAAGRTAEPGGGVLDARARHPHQGRQRVSSSATAECLRFRALEPSLFRRLGIIPEVPRRPPASSVAPATATALHLTFLPSDGIDRSQIRRHVDGLDRAHPQRRQARGQVAARRPPDGGGAQRHERRNQPPAGPGQGTGARPADRRDVPRTRHAGRHRRAGIVGAAGARAAGRGPGSRQLRRLAGAGPDQQRVHQGPHRVDRRQAGARRPRRPGAS